MLKAVIRAILIAQVVILAAGCTDATKYQFGLRGKWRLHSRKLPDGKELKPPAVTGIYEWFPLTNQKAHVTASFTGAENQIQITESIYTLNDRTFAREEHLRIGGGYGLVHQPAYDTPNTTTQGQVAIDGNRTTFTHPDGRIQVYEDVTIAVTEDTFMRITYSDGTVDTWKRYEDQVGVLAN